MRHECSVCGKEIELFAEFWLREPDQFNDEGVAIKQSKPMPFCGLGCIFGHVGRKLRERKGLPEGKAREGGLASRAG